MPDGRSNNISYFTQFTIEKSLHSCYDEKFSARLTENHVSPNPFIGISVTLISRLKGQLQRFHKLISNDRIWPSEDGFEVICEKSLFFEISTFKVRN